LPIAAPSASFEQGMLPPAPHPRRQVSPPVPNIFPKGQQSPWNLWWSRWANPWLEGSDDLPQDLELNQVWAVSWASVTGEGLVLVQASPEEIAEALSRQTISLERWNDGTLVVLKPDGQAECLGQESVKGHALGASQSGDLYRLRPQRPSQ
jgi:hypothetical protein